MSEKMFNQPSTSQQHFSRVPHINVERSTFDRSHGVKTTFDAGLIVPVFIDEVMPGDTYHISSTSFCRLATPLRPIMDNLYLDTHYWFVPMRLLWDNWQKFMGERINPTDDPDNYSVPTISIDLSTIGPDTLASFMGMPPVTAGPAVVDINVLPFRAYHLVWNEWYRDQNLQDSFVITKVDSGDSVDTYAKTQRRNKRHDYFTSCLPWPQKGDPVLIPISPTAPIIGLGIDFGTSAAITPNMPVRETTWQSGDPATTYAKGVYANTTGVLGINVTQEPAGTGPIVPQIFAQLAESTSITINDLRTAFTIQQLLERDARSGTRYIELLKGQWGVSSSDGRLQRPEYLGGGTARVNINPIAATFAGGEIAQGDLGGVGTVVGKGGFKKSFEEHGYVIGVVSARADLTYQQGIERMWWRKSRFDFPFPVFANLGEQAVLNREIYVTGTATDTEVFGYQERYAECRYKPSRITGLFNSGVAASLDVWHVAQDFSALPVLNDSFIREDPPIDRVIAVQTEPHFLCDMYFNFHYTCALPTHGVPGLTRM